MVAFGERDKCLHCKGELEFNTPHDETEEIPSWRRHRPLWFHVDTHDLRCPELPGDPARRYRATPVNWCNERLNTGETCNRPIKEFGKCGIHSKDARIAWEREQRIAALVEQDQHVEELLLPQIEFWNTAYDLDARLEENHGGNHYSYSSGKTRYTGYVTVNAGRLITLMKTIEQEFEDVNPDQ